VAATNQRAGEVSLSTNLKPSFQTDHQYGRLPENVKIAVDRDISEDTTGRQRMRRKAFLEAWIKLVCLSCLMSYIYD
jgi:hypothetical protein